MPTLTELQTQRGTLVTEARSALDAITANTDDARATELEQRHDTIMGQLDKLDANIAREERTARLEKEEQERRERNRPIGPDVVETREGGDQPAGTDRAKGQAEYRAAFDAFLRAGCTTEDLSKEQRSLLRRGHQEVRVQVAGTAQSGGYTVPIDLADQIVKVMKDWGPMYDTDVVTVITTGSGNEYDIPTSDDTNDASSGSKAEADDLKDDNSGDVEFGQAKLNAYVDATPWIKVSFELMQDSAFDLEAFLAGAIGERLGRLGNKRLSTGSGNNAPRGIVTAAGAGVTSASATEIDPDELFDLQHSVNAAYRRSPKCRWMLADQTLLALRKMKDGQGRYLWQLGDIRTGAPDLLLQKPYSINDDVPEVGAGTRPVVFGDFSRYWVRKVGSPMIGTVRERFWPKIGMAGLIRYDGDLVDQNAVKALTMKAA
jgi:HK97 family phage major capsid protein